MAVFDEQYVMSNLSPNNQRPFRDPLELPYAPYTDQSMLGNDYYTGEIDEDDPNYNPYFNKYSNIKNTISKYTQPVMGSIMGGIMGIPGLGYLMSKIPNDPYAKNRIGMYGVGKSSAGFDVDKFGYNLGTTLMKNRYMEPGTNSFRSHQLEALRGMEDRVGNSGQTINDYYQEQYGKSYDDVKSDAQSKNDAFNNTNAFSGTSDNFSGAPSGDGVGADRGQPSGKNETGFGGGYGRNPDDRMANGGRIGYYFGGLAARGMKK